MGTSTQASVSEPRGCQKRPLTKNMSVLCEDIICPWSISWSVYYTIGGVFQVGEGGVQLKPQYKLNFWCEPVLFSSLLLFMKYVF